mgnify:CR=1 FL=1
MFGKLFWIALIVAAVWYWRKSKKKASAPNSPAELEAAPMVRCAHCGVHLPRDRALSLDQRWYCSQAHLEQDKGSSDR